MRQPPEKLVHRLVEFIHLEAEAEDEGLGAGFGVMGAGVVGAI